MTIPINYLTRQMKFSSTFEVLITLTAEFLSDFPSLINPTQLARFNDLQLIPTISAVHAAPVPLLLLPALV